MFDETTLSLDLNENKNNFKKLTVANDVTPFALILKRHFTVESAF